MGTMVNTTADYCKKCEYHFGGDNAIISCDYLLKTGKLRKCPVGKCNKFKKRVKRKEEIPWSEVSNVLSQKNSNELIKKMKTFGTT